MAAVLIPWRPGCPHRFGALHYVTGRYKQAGHQVILGHAPDGRWCKARAIADALDRTTADVLVVADADVWTDGLQDALDGLLQTARWAVPHLHLHRLSERATRAVLSGGPPDLADLENPSYYGTQGGGIVVLHRDTWEQVPMDPRFEGWGGEDHSWGIALQHLAGRPWQGKADLIHLYHPPQPEAPPLRGPSGARNRPKILDPANLKLDGRYRYAKTSRAAMQALVDEAREALCRTPA